MLEVLVGGIFTIVAALLGREVGQRQGEHHARNSADAEAQERALTLQEQLHERFGWKAQAVASSMQVINGQGDTTVRRTYRGVKPGDGMTISHIPGVCWVATPGSRITRGPNFSGAEKYPKAVSMVKQVVSEREHRYRVEIQPPLSGADPPLDFDISVDYSKGVLMTEAEVEEAYRDDPFKLDYLAFDVEMPLDSLALEVDFDAVPGFRPYPVVFNAWSEMTNERELKRVEDGFTKTPAGARFEIADPCVGFRYGVSWKAPRGSKGTGRDSQAFNGVREIR